ncbi:MAG: hypothetical protein MUO23_07610, partial [Anaerolineales bacterium]|nr:hypothetical protein [Anaerolineales bacterium]
MSGQRLQRVADYYDDNTHRFLRFGRSRKAAAIHRRLWAPGVETPDQALRHINQRIAGWVRPTLEAGSGLEVVL